MNDRLKELMEERAINEIESTNSMLPGSEDTVKAVENASKIYRTLMDEENQKERIKNERRNLVFAFLGGISAAAFHSAWHVMDINFEKSGSFVHATTRGLAQSLNKVNPFKIK